TAGIDAELTPRIHDVRSVAHHPAGLHVVTPRIGRGDRMARGFEGKLHAPAVEKRVRGHEQRIESMAREACEHGIDLANGGGTEQLNLQAKVGSGRLHVLHRSGVTSRPSVRAVALTSPISSTPSAKPTSTIIATRRSRGTTSRKSSSRLPAISACWTDSPV